MVTLGLEGPEEPRGAGGPRGRDTGHWSAQAPAPSQVTSVTFITCNDGSPCVTLALSQPSGDHTEATRQL